MAKVLYSATMSLDGFIAGPGGDMSWMTEFLGPNPEAERIVDQVGAVLSGRRSYEGDDPNKGTEKEGAFEGAGTRLFTRPAGTAIKLTRVSQSEAPLATGIHYRVIRSGPSAEADA